MTVLLAEALAGSQYTLVTSTMIQQAQLNSAERHLSLGASRVDGPGLSSTPQRPDTKKPAAGSGAKSPLPGLTAPPRAAEGSKGFLQAGRSKGSEAPRGINAGQQRAESACRGGGRTGAGPSARIQHKSQTGKRTQGVGNKNNVAVVEDGDADYAIDSGDGIVSSNVYDF
jgi:hypothetical protein